MDPMNEHSIPPEAPLAAPEAPVDGTSLAQNPANQGKVTKRKSNGETRARNAQARHPIQNIREVFGYLRRYKGQVFVLKVDDCLLGKPLFPLLIKDIVLLQNAGIQVVLVPGAKQSIDQVLATYAVSSPMQGSTRITSPEAMPLVKLGASNVTNVLISLLAENEAHGVVGNWVRARAMGVLSGVDFQQTGRVEKVNVQLIRNMLEDHLIPIIPNIGWNVVGRDYNLNSNELAVAVAKALQASKLFFVGSEAGIPVVEDCPFAEPQELKSGLFSNLDPEECQQLLTHFRDALQPVHQELITLALQACASGVDRVHIIDGSSDGILLREVFSSAGLGTMIYGKEYDHLHPAGPQDIPEILRMMQPYVDDGILVQRSAETLGEELENYFVYRLDDAVQGCGAIRQHTAEKSAEVYALAVDPVYAGKGIGKRIVQYLLERAKKAGAKQAFLLTTQTSDFFMRLGFKEAGREALPAAKQAAYNTNRNSKVLVKPL
jgi:amino-acid N-acetyltransferase